MEWRGVLLAFMGLSLSCSSGDRTVPLGELTTDVQDVEVVSRTEIVFKPPDLVRITDVHDWQMADTPEVKLDAVVPDLSCESGPAGFGCPCTGNQDCASGWCVLHLGEQVCTETCVEECPAGWICQLGRSGVEELYVCKSIHPSLCLPCSTSAECEGDAKCAIYGPFEGSYCGAGCQLAADCPSGYECIQASTREGHQSAQCVVKDGECGCTAYAVNQEKGTVCELGNEFGTCAGWRTCEAGGLTECDAPVPEVEICDGKDNDCNGTTDEDVQCNDDNECTEDGCSGGDGCEHVLLSGSTCYDGDACTYDDHCQTGACVGVPLDPDDGNPCTDDFCDVETGEYHVNNQAECDDDSNTCTFSICEDGLCKHPPAENGKVCNDGDPCTEDDQCIDGTCSWKSIDPVCVPCGDGKCVYSENATSCPEDCGPCGDGVCGIHENGPNGGTCPQDCLTPCGNGICEGGEKPENCLVDCGQCGDTFCGLNESHDSCPDDCPPTCGDKECQGDETPDTCPADCMAPCGDGICETGENPLQCPVDCAVCGDGVCAKEETAEFCPKDCATACGNGKCEGGENPNDCPEDCGSCGDKTCGFGEDGQTCPADCWEGCGDGDCQPTLGENESNCPTDCVPDKDKDGVEDADDNCQYKANPEQEDADGDGAGDECDPDDDNDDDLDITDCQPFEPLISHFQGEVCDGIDNDCDGAEDEADAVGCKLYYVDIDGDGWGVKSQSKCLCWPTDLYVTLKLEDCAPFDPETHPEADETCDGSDNDCNGQIDEGHPDNDGDKIADCIDLDDDNDGDPDLTDCQPVNSLVSHSAKEVCNGVDDNCSGEKDEGSVCDDGVECTVDACLGQLGCSSLAAHALCDDGNSCTTESCDSDTGCQYEPMADGVLCGGGPQWVCSGGVCQCTPECGDMECGDDGCGTICGSCDDGLDCTTDSCNNGMCENPIVQFYCVVDGICVPSGTEEPGNQCRECQPLLSQSDWSPLEDGVSCGTTGKRCFVGNCCNYMAHCVGKECGDDGCGQTCGDCLYNNSCIDNQCMCLNWEKTFQPDGHEEPQRILQAKDGGFAVLVKSNSKGAGLYDFWLIKLGSHGDMEWDKTYGTGAKEMAVSIDHGVDGGYVMAGYVLPEGPTDWTACDVWVVKVDDEGNLEWDKTLGGTEFDSANCIRQTADGGYVVAGSTKSKGAGDRDVWVIKLDGGGKIEWDETYGGAGSDSGYAVRQTDDGGYVVVGPTESKGAGDSDIWVVKLDGQGNMQWDSTFGGGQSERGHDINATADGGYIVVGETESKGAGDDDAWVIKLDGKGKLEWDKTLGSEKRDVGYQIEQTVDGGYLVSGTKTFAEGDSWVAKLTWQGEVEWDKMLDKGPGASCAKDSHQVNTNQYVVLSQFNVGGPPSDLQIVKLDANGNAACECGDGVCNPDAYEDCNSCPGDCGCGDGEVCVTFGECCVPDCAGKQCGDDGCQGSCGDCECGEECDDDICMFHACDDKECGDNGCGESCGECPEGSTCDGGGIANQCGWLATQVVGGIYHTCALLVDGEVNCWGWNHDGQLGIGSVNDTVAMTPETVLDLDSSIKELSSGTFHVCGVTEGGSLKCWGNNYNGGLGDGTKTDRGTPITPQGLDQGILSVAAGGSHTCAVLESGAVKCWGSNNYGQVGDGTKSDRTAPTDVVGLGAGVLGLAAAYHTCALLNDGSVKCWGNNKYGQVGDGTVEDRTEPTDVVGIGEAVADIAVGNDHTCVLTTAGGVKCWGHNRAGELGDGTTDQSLLPVDVQGMHTGVLSIAAGSSHTCAMVEGEQLWCWGAGNYGQLGGGTTEAKSVPADVIGLDLGVTSVGAGASHTCAVLTGGGVNCWGFNDHGQLGDGTIAAELIPVSPPGIEGGAVQVAVGSNHSCALFGSGETWCWGNNGFGQLGLGDKQARPAPEQVPGLPEGAYSLAAWSSATGVRLDGGSARCWGYNASGQLGDGSQEDLTSPSDVSALQGEVTLQMDGGYGHSCALLEGGATKCWGDNTYGQLGDGTVDDKLSPTQVLGLSSGTAAISSGNTFSCALLGDGVLKCWGRNAQGALGDGTLEDRTTPVEVLGLDLGVLAIETGSNHTCALLAGGRPMCWGGNWLNQLGDGTTTKRTEPVDVLGLDAGVAALSAGSTSTCALMESGSLKCWGYNQSGQIGDGTTETAAAPVGVLGLAGQVSAVAVGSHHACAIVADGAMMCWGSDQYGQVTGNGLFYITPHAVVGFQQE